VNALRAAALSAGALIAIPLAAAAAQQADSIHPQKTFLTRRDAIVGGSFLLASAGLSVFDKRLEHFFEDTTLVHVREGQRLDKVFTHVNETTLTLGGLLTWGVARLAHAPTVADIAFHTAESVMLASGASQLIRGPLGRARPSVSPDDQYKFRFGKGFREFDNRSFPSIHSSSGFAAASALVAETRLRAPHAVRYVAPIAYILALTPGLSRMYLGEHWASDVFAGAFMGTWAGWRVVDYSHAHHGNWFDRTFLGTGAHLTAGYENGSLGLGWSSGF
jgi:membrane-associated phospholipid phosphatase